MLLSSSRYTNNKSNKAPRFLYHGLYGTYASPNYFIISPSTSLYDIKICINLVTIFYRRELSISALDSINKEHYYNDKPTWVAGIVHLSIIYKYVLEAVSAFKKILKKGIK